MAPAIIFHSIKLSTGLCDHCFIFTILRRSPNAILLAYVDNKRVLLLYIGLRVLETVRATSTLLFLSNYFAFCLLFTKLIIVLFDWSVSVLLSRMYFSI